MQDENGNTIAGPLDPMLYIGRATRGRDGRVRQLEVFYDDDTLTVSDQDEFFTFRTEALLEEPRQQ